MSDSGSAPGPSSKRPRVTALIGVLVALRLLTKRLRRTPDPAAPPPVESDEDVARVEIPASPRAETVVAVLLGAAGVLGVGFAVAYGLDGTNAQVLGLVFGGMLALLAAAAIIAGKLVVPQETAVEERGRLLVREQAHEVLEVIEGGGRGISRRKLLLGAAGTAGAGVLVAAATPLLSLGPDLDGIGTSPWRAGMRLADESGTPYQAADIEIGSFYTALPESGDLEELGAALLVVKLPAEFIHLPPARAGWAPQGILAYSKICPHAACAISLYRYPLYEPTTGEIPAFTCPCHYSTFAPGLGGRLLFGPAGRSLPQLPLTIDDRGYLRAAGPFHESIGPSWWHVQRSES